MLNAVTTENGQSVPSGGGMQFDSFGCSETGEAVIDTPGEVLHNGIGYLAALHDFLRHTMALFRRGDELRGNEQFLELVQGMDWLVQLINISRSELKLNFTTLRFGNQTLEETVEALNRVLLELLSAQEQRDLVLMADLLDYELAPQLQLWQDIFITVSARGTGMETVKPS